MQNSNRKKRIRYLQELVIENDRQKVVDILLLNSKYFNKKLEMEIVSIAARLNELDHNKLTGTISYKEIQLEINSLNIVLIEILSKIEKDESIKLHNLPQQKSSEHRIKIAEKVLISLNVIIILLLIFGFFLFKNSELKNGPNKSVINAKTINGTWLQIYDSPSRLSICNLYNVKDKIVFDGISYDTLNGSSRIVQKGMWRTEEARFNMESRTLNHIYTGTDKGSDKTSDYEAPGKGSIFFNDLRNKKFYSAWGDYISQNEDYMRINFHMVRITEEMADQIGYKIPHTNNEKENFVNRYFEFQQKKEVWEK